MNGFWRAAKPDFGIDVPEERYTLWFDMHTVEYTRAYGKAAGFGDAQEKWLEKAHPFPVFMLDEAPGFPSVRRFPIEDVVQTVGRDYFTSTVAYAAAFALATGDDIAEVAFYGIDLVHDSEYTDQKPCAEYWIARLEGAGIKVHVHEQSALLKQRARYGYTDPSSLSAGMRAMLTAQAEGLRQVIAKDRAEQERLIGQLHTNDGALQSIEAVLQRLAIYDRGGQV